MMRSLVRTTLTSLAALLCVVALAPTAHADGGLRAGFSSGPDQFLFGAQIEPDPVAKNLHIVPSGEVGIGDDLLSLQFNGDLQYRFRTDSGVRPYVGGGLTVAWYDPDGAGDSNTEVGVNILGGLYFGKSTPMFVDVKLGLTDDVPDLKAVFGINIF
jgi:hypothetical protein